MPTIEDYIAMHARAYRLTWALDGAWRLRWANVCSYLLRRAVRESERARG